MLPNRRRIAQAGSAFAAIVSLSLVTPGPCRADNPAVGQGFALPKEDEAFDTGLEDFSRYCGKKQWDAAFRALSKVFDQPLKGFSAADDGILLPAGQRVRKALLTLPAAGLNAYHLFFDAQGKRLYDDAVASGDADRVPLQKVVDQFFLTASGAAATDRLGDAEFEAGDFAAAARHWAMLADESPDASLPTARLLCKRATALARLNRWDAVHDVADTLATRHAGEQVTFGGQSVSAVDYVRALRPADSASPATGPSLAPTTAPSDVFAGLPQTTAEAWQTAFLGESLAEEFHNALQNTGWGRFMDPPDATIPPSAIDGQRVYVAWLGIAFAIDLKTGKLAWRTDKFTKLNGQGMQYIEMGGDGGSAITAAAGHVFAVGVDLPGTNGQRFFNPNEGRPLQCLDAATGKMVWATNKGALTALTFLGAPVLVDGVLYATAAKQAEMQLIGLDPDKGTSLFALPLGNAVAGTDFRGQTKYPAPLLRVIDGTLYVLTNDGALLAVDPASRTVRWALRTEAPEMMDRENMIIFSDDVPPPKVEPPGDIVTAGGMLYLKETATHTLYAVDPAVPKVLWKRPLEKDENIAADRSGHLVTVGSAVEAIDPASHALLWSTTVAAKTGRMRPVFDGDRMLVESARGLFLIDTRTGDVADVSRGTDRGAVGADLMTAGDKLVCVSNRAVTAYSLGPTTRPAR